MTKLRLPIFLTFLGLFLAIGSIVTVAIIDRSLADRQPVTFTASTGDPLVGSYYPGTEPVGVILLEGFGSDQVTMTSLASEFARSGYHVFTFDFSGHGRSPGTLTFDNAQTDRLAYQALSALEEFKHLSGLRADQIFVVGHSLGARVALQSATMNQEKVAGLVLLGTQVNLSTNVQSEFFTGTTDADLPWVQSLGPENPPVPILMISGAWDDILTPENAELLLAKLTDSRYYTRDGNTFISETYSTTEGSIRFLGVTTCIFRRPISLTYCVVHNYEPFSGQIFLSIRYRFVHASLYRPDVFGQLSESGDIPTPFKDAMQTTLLRQFSWIIGFVGMMLFVSYGKQWIESCGVISGHTSGVSVVNSRRFLWGKLLLWLGALPVAAILGSLFFVIPLGKPVFNLIYVGFIGWYGILLFLLYWRGKMPGVQGKLPFVTDRSPVEWKRILAALGIAIGMLVLTAAYARTGWFYVFPVNVRLVWLVVFTPFTALGFWIGLHEGQMVRQAGSRSAAQTALTLIGLFPFFLYSLLMAAIGSLSGMIGGLQGLLILWLVLAFGNLLQAVGRRPWLTSICMAVLLYWLILPQGVLF